MDALILKTRFSLAPLQNKELDPIEIHLGPDHEKIENLIHTEYTSRIIFLHFKVEKSTACCKS